MAGSISYKLSNTKRRIAAALCICRLNRFARCGGSGVACPEVPAYRQARCCIYCLTSVRGRMFPHPFIQPGKVLIDKHSRKTVHFSTNTGSSGSLPNVLPLTAPLSLASRLKAKQCPISSQANARIATHAPAGKPRKGTRDTVLQWRHAPAAARSANRWAHVRHRPGCPPASVCGTGWCSSRCRPARSVRLSWPPCHPRCGR